MSLDINVPGGNPRSPGFSVQRSPNGLSISAGALASTNTKFGMANDEGGLSVSAYPVRSPFFVLAAVQGMFDDGSNFAAVSAAWDAVGLDTCDFECFIAEPGANFTVNWSGSNVVLPAPRWAYPEVFTPNEHWSSLGVKTTHRPASETDLEGTSAIWDVPGDAQVVDSGGGLSGYWFIFRAPVRVDEPGTPPDPATYPEWVLGTQYNRFGYDPPNYCTHNGNYYSCLVSNSSIEPPNGTYWGPMIFGGLLRSYGLHAYYNISVLPDQNGFADCHLARNYVIAPAAFNPIPALETPSNYPAWPPEA